MNEFVVVAGKGGVMDLELTGWVAEGQICSFVGLTVNATFGKADNLSSAGREH